MLNVKAQAHHVTRPLFAKPFLTVSQSAIAGPMELRATSSIPAQPVNAKEKATKMMLPFTIIKAATRILLDKLRPEDTGVLLVILVK